MAVQAQGGGGLGGGDKDVEADAGKTLTNDFFFKGVIYYTISVSLRSLLANKY